MSPTRTRWQTALHTLALGTLLSCGVEDPPPEGQFVIHVTTDAPLASGFGVVSESGEWGVSLFDRLTIEVFPSGETTPCEACVREFEVDAASANDGRMSVGVVPQPNETGVRVRVRLFRGNLDAPAPRPTSTLESVVLLPKAPREGVAHLTVLLSTDDVGSPVGTFESPSNPAPGRPRPGQAGTWRGSDIVTCSSEPQPDEACVPGGPFWMGDPRLDVAGVSEYQGDNERLVVLTPFFLDRTEVTVGAFRESGLAESDSSGVFNPQPARPGSLCTYAQEPSTGDDRPVTCLTWRLARAYC